MTEKFLISRFDCTYSWKSQWHKIVVSTISTDNSVIESISGINNQKTFVINLLFVEGAEKKDKIANYYDHIKKD